MTLTVQSILAVMNKKGYAVASNDQRDYNLNLVGIRTLDKTPNTFNDFLCVFWKYKTSLNFKVFPCTTDPGLYYLLHPMNPLGTAIVKEGQYKNCWALGLHKGYEALVQVGNITVIRDYDKDNVLDYASGKEETGNSFHIDCHRANENGQSIQVDKWSAGCQVLQNRKILLNGENVFEYDYFLSLCKESAKIWGNHFTYTLLNEADFN